LASKSKLVKPENTLKKKAGSGGFNESDLMKAQNMIETNEIDFAPLAMDLLKELAEILKKIKSGEIKKEDYFDQIMYPLMQLKSQGALFRYPLVTKISHLMLDFLENIKSIDSNAIEIVEAYKKSVTAIITLKLKDVNNKAGLELCKALSDAFDRYFKVIEKS